MKIPNIEKNQFALLMADSKTGIILNIEKEVHRNDLDNEAFLIFQNKEDISDFIDKTIKTNKEIEFMIYNYKHELVDFIKPK